MKEKIIKWKSPNKEYGLCRWDFCQGCIGYRIKNKLPMPKLKTHPSKKK